MLKIKLTPRGKTHQITYRIVVAEEHSKNNGKFVDDIGFYTPQTKTLKIDQEKMDQWIKNGAKLSEGTDKLLHPEKYPKKVKRVKTEKTATEKTPNENSANQENGAEEIVA